MRVLLLWATEVVTVLACLTRQEATYVLQWDGRREGGREGSTVESTLVRNNSNSQCSSTPYMYTMQVTKGCYEQTYFFGKPPARQYHRKLRRLFVDSGVLRTVVDSVVL